MPNFAIQATTPSKTASSPPQPQPTCRINLEAIAARVSALLPQKSDPAKFERILPTLKTPDYRVALTKETRQEITEQRKLLMTEFFEINGSFSADPASQLFIAKRKFIDLEADYNKQAKIPFDRNATSSTS